MLAHSPIFILRKLAPVYSFLKQKEYILQRRYFFDQVDRDWNKAWEKNLIPWDLKGDVSPPLIEAIEKKDFNIYSTSKVLVPGCGSGYDCLYFYKMGASKTVGIDLSSKAIEIAKINLSMHQNRDSHYYKNDITFLTTDFFGFSSLANEKYDVIYDYLFFSAIEPGLHLNWATSMHSLLLPKSGILVTILFPLYNGYQKRGNGPPYHVDIDDYKKVLEPLGFFLYGYKNDVKSIKQRQGREAIAYWKIK